MRKWRHDRGDNKNFKGIPAVDLTGKKFGKLTVVGLRPGRKFNSFIWNCICDCGNIKDLPTGKLTNKKTRTCGCAARRRQSASPTWKGVGEISSVRWKLITYRAWRVGRECTITHEEAWELFLKQNRRCAFSDVELNFGTHNKNHGDASLDRNDSSKGYVEGNVQWVHRDVNFMKQAMTDEALIEWCKKIVRHRAPEINGVGIVVRNYE